MIKYDGKTWCGYFRIEGSVMLKAAPLALLVAAVTGVLKYLDEQGIIALTEMEIIKNSAAYSGFTFVLGFVLVFRSSQCYSRFWTCAQSCCTMRAQLAEGAGSLLTFAIMTKATEYEVKEFSHKVVRLVSLLHALCLQHATDMDDKNFLVIDVAGLGKERMDALEKLGPKGRVEIVYQWLGALVMTSAKTGLLSTPPPILSRVFQEFEKGMIEYNQVLQVMSIPFPFPYAQVCVALLLLNVILTPFVMVQWVNSVPVACLLSFISTLCLVSIELISAELENPLGDDANDLPCHEWQATLNEALQYMLHPCANDVFELEPTAHREFWEPDGKTIKNEVLQPIENYLSKPDEGHEHAPVLKKDHGLAEGSKKDHGLAEGSASTPHATTVAVQSSPAAQAQQSTAKPPGSSQVAPAPEAAQVAPAAAPPETKQDAAAPQQPQAPTTDPKGVEPAPSPSADAQGNPATPAGSQQANLNEALQSMQHPNAMQQTPSQAAEFKSCASLLQEPVAKAS